jgi:RHS repeat-associated protein
LKRSRSAAALGAVLLVVGIALFGALPAATTAEDDRGRALPASLRLDEIRQRQSEEAEQRRAQRATPEAKANRERSRSAFRGQSSAEAEDLARSRFETVFDRPLWRGNDVPAGSRVARYLNDYSYVLDRASGPNLLVQSFGPLRAPDDAGRKAPIDTELRGEGSALVPANTLGSVRIAKDAASVDFPGSGIGFRLAGARAADARTIDDKAFYANVDTDTDLVVAALPAAVETFLQLRSDASPEKSELEFSLPPGARLREVAGTGAEAGAEIVRGRDRLGSISPVHAVDADGETVPAEFSVDGDRLVMRVDHRGGDWRYPILVDPVYSYVVEDFPFDNCRINAQGAAENCTTGNGTAGNHGWTYATTGASGTPGFESFDCSANPWCWATAGVNGAGLYVKSLAGSTWGSQNSWASWAYRRPTRPEQQQYGGNDTSIVRVQWTKFSHVTESNTDPKSCAMGLISSPNDRWSVLQVGGVSSGVAYICPNVTTNNYGTCAVSNCTEADAPNNYAVFGLHQVKPNTTPDWAMIGHPIVHEWDKHRPFIDGSSATAALDTPPPAGWVENAQHSFKVKSTDRGLGVQKLYLRKPTAAGGWAHESRTYYCGNRVLACPLATPSGDVTPFSYSTSADNLPEGAHTYAVQAIDAVGNPTTGDYQTDETHDGRFNAFQWQVKLDRSPPNSLTLAGPVSKKYVGDGSAQALDANSADAHSGIRTTELELDAAADTFNRTTSSGWGTGDGGGAWTVDEGPASDFSAAPSTGGRISFPVNGGSRSANLLESQHKNVDASVRVKMAQPVTGAGQGSYAWLQFRRQNATARYRVGLIGTDDGRLMVMGRNEAGGTLFPDQNTPLGFSAGTWYRLRVQADSGSSTTSTTIRVKYWRDSDPEPAAWNIVTTSSVGPFAAGTVGLRVQGGSTTAQQFHFDDLKVLNLDVNKVNENKVNGTTCTTAGCPSTFPTSFGFNTAGFSEGPHTYRVTTRDPLSSQGLSNHSLATSRTVHIDRTDPDLALSGEAYVRRYDQASPQTLDAGEYNLHMHGRDGRTSAAGKDGSGMNTLRVFVDDTKNLDGTWVAKTTPSYEESQPCAEGNCEMHRDWSYSTRDVPPDAERRIRVEAEDHVGRKVQKHFVVKRSLVPRHDFSDKLGLEEWFQYDSTDTGAGTRAHVNLASGNLVWHSTPVVNPGRGLSSVANLTYNSQVRPLDGPFPYDQAGRGFSFGLSGITRVNEPLDVTTASAGIVRMTDPDGTRHQFTRKSAAEPMIYDPPPGVHLHLRRYSHPLQPVLDPATLLQDKKAWAATRPDGVTYFFDGGGWPTTIEDRNGNVLRYDYEWFTVAGTPCPVRSELDVFSRVVCKRRMVRLVDAAGVFFDSDPETTGEPNEDHTKRNARSIRLDYASNAKVGHWRMNDSSSSQLRDAAGANHGTYVGGHTLGQTGATRDGDSAVRFDGTGYGSVPDAAALDVGDEFTVEAWFKREGTRDDYLLSKGINGLGIRLRSGKLSLRKTGIGIVVESKVPVLADGLWHHVAVTKKGSDARIYQDGVDVSGPVTNLTIENTAEAFNIGTAVPGTIERWTGSIDDVALYGKMLSAVDVAQRFLQGGFWQNRISKVTDHGGRETRLDYDDSGYLTKLTQALGAGAANGERSFQFAYEDQPKELASLLVQRKLTKLTDPRGANTDFRYEGGIIPVPSANGPLPAIDDLAGRRVCAVHDRGDPGTPDPSTDVEEETDEKCPLSPGTKQTRYSYTYESACGGTCTAVADPLSTPAKPRTTDYKLDPTGRMTEMQDAKPAGSRGKTLLGWDARNNVTSMATGADTTEEATTLMEYNANGMLKKVTAPFSRVTELTYDDTAGTMKSQQPNALAGGASIDEGGKFVSDLRSIKRPNGKTWSFDVDGRGNVIRQTDPESNFAETFYDVFGRITHEVDWRKPGTVDPQKNPIDVTAYCHYDDNGMPQYMWTPRGLPSTVPDRNATGCTDYGPNDHRWLFKYDVVGNLTHATDPREAKAGDATARSKYTTVLAYDKLDRLRSETSSKDSSGTTPTTRTRTYGYDVNDNLTTQTDGNTKTWERAYTAMDRLREEKSPSVAHEGETGTAQEVASYEYDIVENRVKEIRPEAKKTGAAADSFTTEHRYDEIGRLVASIRRSRAAGESDVDLATSYRYDRRGNLIGIADPKINAANSGTAPEQNALDGKLRWLYEYDLLDNRTAAVEDPGGTGHLNLKTQFEYDANDNLTFVTDPRGTASSAAGDFRTEYVYDDAGRVKAHVDALGGRTEWELRPDGRALSKTTPRGTATAAADDFKAKFEYYKGGDLLSYTLPVATQDQYPSGKGTIRYAQRDAVGNPTQIQDARGNTFANTFYDGGELKTTTRPSWWNADLESGQVGEADPVESTPASPDDAAQIVRGAVRRATEGDEEGGAPSVPSFSSDPTAVDPDLPGSEGHGDFGEVKPEGMPDVLPAAGAISLEYDGEMRLSGVNETTCADCKTTIGRDDIGRMTELKQPYDVAGTSDVYISRTFGYDRHGNQRRSSDGEGHASITTYDQFDRRSTQTDPDSNKSRWTYDPNDNVTLVESPKGTADGTSNEDFAVRMTYDGLDRLTQRENGVKRKYPTDNGAITRGERTTFEDFDLLGNPRKIRAPRGNEPGLEQTERDQFVTKKEFDELNRIKKVTDVSGHSTEYEYDANGNLTKLTAPGSRPNENHEELQEQVTAITYDGRDLPWTKTTGSGTHRRVTATEYDANGNVRRVVNPRGIGATTNLPSNSDSAPPTTSPGSSTDAGNALLKDATLHATVYEHDVDNMMTSIHLPWGDEDPEDRKRWRRDYERDTRGRVSAMNTAYEWTGSDVERCKEYKRSTTNPYCTARTTYSYYDTGWIKEQTEPVATDPADTTQTPRQVGGTRINYDYFPDGNQQRWRVLDSSGNQRRLVERFYTPGGRLSERKGYFGASTTPGLTYEYEWDPNGNLELMRHNFNEPQKDRVTEFDYDDADRPTLTNEKPFDDGTRSRGKDTVVTYDENGNVKTRKTDGRLNPTTEDPDRYVDGKIAAFTYDALDREIKSQTTRDTNKRTVKTCWFASGQRESRTRINGEDPDTDCRSHGEGKLRARDTYFYADDGRLTSKTRTPDSGDPKTETYEYDGNGNRKKDERGTHVFNSRNHVVRWTRADGMRAENKSIVYTVNGAGVVTKKDDDATQGDGGGVTEFTILGERIERAEFTPVGGAPKTTANYTNNVFGNVEKIEETTGSTTRTTTYKYDQFERMIEATGPAVEDPQDGDPDERKVRYEYDGLDRRDTKCVGFTGSPTPETNCPGGKKHDYSYIGTSERLSQEAPLQAEGKTRSYDYDAGNERLGMEKGDGTYKSYATDAQGSVLGLEGTNGAIAQDERYEYDPYGELQKRKGQTAGEAERPLSDDAKENPFRFQGHYYDSGVKTYDMRARSYRPDMGRFLTADRFEASSGDMNLVADPLTQNRFAFAGGNPVSNVEWDGHVYSTEGPDSCSQRCSGGAKQHDTFVKIHYPARKGRPAYTVGGHGHNRGRVESSGQWRRQAPQPGTHPGAVRTAMVKSGTVLPPGKLSREEATTFINAFERNNARALKATHGQLPPRAEAEFRRALESGAGFAEHGDPRFGEWFMAVALSGGPAGRAGTTVAKPIVRRVATALLNIRRLTSTGVARVRAVRITDAVMAAPRKGSALKSDLDHYAASFVSREELMAGRAFRPKGGDGRRYWLLQTEGRLRGQKGLYEFIYDKGYVTHQRFIPGKKYGPSPN